jgi:hypothetical protein
MKSAFDQMRHVAFSSRYGALCLERFCLFLLACLLCLAHDTPPVNGPDWIGLDWIAGSGVFCACEVKRYVESWKFDICMVEVLPC